MLVDRQAMPGGWQPFNGLAWQWMLWSSMKELWIFTGLDDYT